MSYRDVTNEALKYATCAAGCGAAGNWQTAVVDAGVNVSWTSLALGATGRVHVSYDEILSVFPDDVDLKYIE